MKNIDLSNPFNGSKYLKLFEPSKRYGLSFIKNLSIGKNYLGFEIKSNNHGLRGPDNIKSNLVVCGTSFAMGMSNDNGDNWYDFLDDKKFLNVGFPVGTINHINRIEDIYEGSYDKLIYLNHPNNFVLSNKYMIAYEKGLSIFSVMGWKTSFFSTLKLYFIWKIKKIIYLIKKIYLKIYYQNCSYLINTKYSFFDINKNADFAKLEDENLSRLFKLFKKVIAVRVPVKEQLTKHKSHNLENLNINYNYNYSFFKNICDKNSVKILDLKSNFNLTDYHENDTHWNKSGNHKFYQLIKSYL